jgi:tetratricopeptide (TPR) repeat protein
VIRKLAIGLAFGWACCAQLQAAEPRIGKYVQYDTGEFVILTSRNPAQARRIVEDLARFRLVLERVLAKRATKSAFPTTIVIASASDWKNWLQPAQRVAGYFQPARFANYITFDGDASREEVLAIVFHEYTHFFLRSQFAGEYPPWFNEGLAEVMGNARFEKGQVILQVPVWRVLEARQGNWIPFERLLRVDEYDAEYRSHKLAGSFYAQSWLAVQYGMVENRDFGRQVLKYLTELNKLVPQEEAARTSFGDLAAADKRLFDYSRRSSLPQGGMTLGELPQTTFPAGVPLDEMAAMSILAGVMLDSRLPPGRILPLVDSLERRDPNKSRAAILAARVAVAAEDHAAFEQAVTRAEAAIATDDWQQHRELASVLLTSGTEGGALSTRKSEDTRRDVTRAMKWFGEAIAHNNKDVKALWGFGTAATELGKNLDIAEQSLVAAYQLAPSSPEIAMSLVNLKFRQDKLEDTIPYLQDVIRYATHLGARQWAADTLVEVRKVIAERDAAEAENRRRREDYEKQLAEYEKKYGKKKKATQ